MARFAPALLALLLIAPPALAPHALAQTPPPDAAARAAAAALGERLGFQAQSQAILGSMRNQVAINLARSSGKPPEEVAKTVDEIVMPDINAHADELVAIIVDAWASSFSVAELGELRNFYATPLGAKLVRSGAPMAQLVATASRVWAQGQLQRSVQAHESELRARGLRN